MVVRTTATVIKILSKSTIKGMPLIPLASPQSQLSIGGWIGSIRCLFIIIRATQHLTLKVEQVTDQKFTNLSKLPKINNLQPMANLELAAEFVDYMESTNVEADLKLKPRIPAALNGLGLQLTYLDEKRQEHVTLVTIEDQEIISTKK